LSPELKETISSAPAVTRWHDAKRISAKSAHFMLAMGRMALPVVTLGPLGLSGAASRRHMEPGGKPRRSDPLENESDTLPHTDAHGAQGMPTAGGGELPGGGGSEARTGHAEGMAEGDGAAVRIHVLGVVG